MTRLVTIGLGLMVAPVLLLAVVHWGGDIAALAGVVKVVALGLYFLGFASLVIGGILVLVGLGGWLWKRLKRQHNA